MAKSEPLRVMQLLPLLRDGTVIQDMEDQLALMNKQVLLTGKKGTITLTIEMLPIKDTLNAVSLKSTVKAKIPERPIRSNALYIDSMGGLHPNDPTRQESLDIGPRPVADPKPAIQPVAAVASGSVIRPVGTVSGAAVDTSTGEVVN